MILFGFIDHCGKLVSIATLAGTPVDGVGNRNSMVVDNNALAISCVSVDEYPIRFHIGKSL